MSSFSHLLRRPTAAALVAAAALAAPLRAQIVPGSTLTFTGTADATDVGLGGVLLDFRPNRVDAATSGNTGTFASLDRPRGAGVSGHIDDLRVGTGPQLDRNFLVLGGYRFTLAGLPAGTYGQDACYTLDFAPGQRCTPYQSVQGDPAVNVGPSPWYVENVASGNPDAPIDALVAFDLFGTVTGPGGATSSFVGTISTRVVGLPYQLVLYALEQQGLAGVPFTGTFVAGQPLGGRGGAVLAAAALDAGDADLAAAEDPPVAVAPEPSSFVLVVPGVLGVIGVARRQQRWRRVRS